MKTSMFNAALLTSCLVAVSCTPPDQQSGVRPGLYAFHTGQAGTCPGLDWHVTVEPNYAVTGLVSWDNNQHVAKIAGTISPQDGAFHANAQEVGGAGRTATISGTGAGTNIRISISGTGGACDGVVLNIPRVTGGMGGGGG